jgi:lysophospholipase L1-like esterase
VVYWRRANIYMKDFLMKICYYPLVVRFKKLGTTGSVVAAIAGTFVLTWFLHSYQWFWIRGVFPLSAKDAVFWALLGAGVMINSVRDMNKSRQKNANDTPWKAAVRQSLSAGATFVVITTLWSIWTCDSLTQWFEIWKYADAMSLLIAAVSFAIVFVLYLLFESSVGPWRGNSAPPVKGSQFRLRPAATLCLLPAALLIAGSSDAVVSKLPGEQQEIVKSLFWNTPNKSGEEFMVRGYYEGLMDTARFSPALEDAMSAQPKNWTLLENTAAVKATNDLRTRALVPNVKLVVNEVPFETNRWALRDQDYEREKPAGKTRLAFLGSSITMGWNVPKELTFEALFEKELNDASGGKFEALNFAVNGYSIVSLAEQMEADVLQYKPDIVVVISHPEDPGRAVFMLAKSLAAGFQPKDEYLRDLLKKADVTPADPRNRMERKLGPYKMELTRWAYERISSICRANKIRPWLVLLPGVLQRSTGDLDRELVRMAQDAGYETIPLHDVYQGETDRAKLAVAPWDAHPNARGHRLVASSLEDWIRQHDMVKYGQVSVKAQTGLKAK